MPVTRKLLAAAAACALSMALWGLVGCSSAPSSGNPPEGDAGQPAPAETAQDGNAPSTVSVSPKASTNDYTWEELGSIASEISASGSMDAALEIAKEYNLVNADGKLDGTQVKEFELNDGTPTGAQIIGFYHDELADGGGKAGITFIMTESPVLKAMNSRDYNGGTITGGWEESELRMWLGNDFKTQLPVDLIPWIHGVNKYTNNKGSNAQPSDVTATIDEIWIPSFVEVYGPRDAEGSEFYQVYNAEGTQYQLYRDVNVDDERWTHNEPQNEVLVKILSETVEDNSNAGERTLWWQRTPNPSTDNYFRCIGHAGDWDNGVDVVREETVIAAFCF